MKKTPKQLFNLVFVFFCFLLGVIGTIIVKQFFSSFSLVETVLIILPPVYFITKYHTNTTIIKYQDNDYTPSKKERFFDDLITNINVYIIQPICLDFLYACSLLIVVKWIDPNALNPLANGVYWIYQFNKEYIYHPLLILFVVLGILTLLNVLSHTVLKKARTFKEAVSFPLKLAAVLMLFINIDQGISNKYIAWKINYEPLTQKSAKVSFDVSEAQQQEMKGVIDAYVGYMLDVLAAEQQNEDEQYSAYEPPVFFNALNILGAEIRKMPGIRKDLYQGYAGASGPLTLEESGSMESFVRRYQFEQNKTTLFKDTRLYEDGFR